MADYIPRWCTHPSINRAWRRVTSLIATNALPLSQTTNHQMWEQFHGDWSRNDGALWDQKSDNNNPNKNDVRSAWRRVSGSKKNDLNRHERRGWLTVVVSRQLSRCRCCNSNTSFLSATCVRATSLSYVDVSFSSWVSARRLASTRLRRAASLACWTLASRAFCINTPKSRHLHVKTFFMFFFIKV